MDIKYKITEMFGKRKRCQFQKCRNKLGLLPTPCRCGIFCCGKHRFSHNCTYDYQKYAREKLIMQNPKIAADKFERID